MWLFSTLSSTISRLQDNHITALKLDDEKEKDRSMNNSVHHELESHYLSSEDYPDIYQLEPRNCSSFVPPAVWAAMAEAEADFELRNGQKLEAVTNKLLIPDDYLVECLVSSISKNARHWNAFKYAVDSELNFSLALNELIAFDHEGELTLKVTVELDWHDPHLSWNRSHSRLPKWAWPEATLLPVDKLWTPKFTMLNCKARQPDHQLSLWLSIHTLQFT